MNTIEKNKLIAEFMQKGSEGFGLYDFDGSHWRLDQLEFHSSWDWLMPVVDKIEGLTEVDTNGCFFVLESIGNHSKFILDDGTRIFGDTVEDTRQESIFIAVVEFIQWYNKQNK